MQKVLGLAVALVAFVAVGCGGDDGGGDGNGGAASGCSSDFNACGGDLIGSWQITSLCLENPEQMLDTTGLPPACSDMVPDFDYRPEGTLVFGEDGTGTIDITLVADAVIVITEQCLAAQVGSDVTVSASVCNVMESSFDSTSVFQGGSCELAGNGCRCLMTTVEQSFGSGGSYRIEGNEIVEDTGEREAFCVVGNTLTVRGESLGIAMVMTFTRQ